MLICTWKSHRRAGSCLRSGHSPHGVQFPCVIGPPSGGEGSGYRILDRRAELLSFDLTPTWRARNGTPNENCCKRSRIQGSLPEVSGKLTCLEWGRLGRDCEANDLVKKAARVASTLSFPELDLTRILGYQHIGKSRCTSCRSRRLPW